MGTEFAYPRSDESQESLSLGAKAGIATGMDSRTVSFATVGAGQKEHKLWNLTKPRPEPSSLLALEL